MKITILAVGTRGDVQPYVALGRGLCRRGHAVRLAAAADFETFVRAHGLDFARLDANFRDLMQADGLQHGMQSRNPLRRMQEVMGLVQETVRRFAADTWEACQGAEAIIFSTIAVTGYSVAERLGVPSCWAPLTPMTPTRAFSTALWPFAGGHPVLNLLSHRIADQVAWQPARTFINRWRASLGLSPFPLVGPTLKLERERYPVLYGFSPFVVPKPADWSDAVHVPGYWFLDREAGWQPPGALAKFIESGAPPVYIGFGSMINRSAQALTRTVVEALKLCGQRAVVATGWDSLSRDELGDLAFSVDSVPHDWLFPRMAAVVHHGGAGTTAAGLRAGVPSVIVPFAADQPFWARRVFELGAGTRPTAVQDLTAQGLAQAITTAVTDHGMQECAEALGQKIRAEDGVERAVEVFEDRVIGRARR
ncbi:MAG: glycosyltransferase [Anaerolineae bacterium]